MLDTELEHLRDTCARQAALLSVIAFRITEAASEMRGDEVEIQLEEGSLGHELLSLAVAGPKFSELPPGVKERALEWRKENFGV